MTDKYWTLREELYRATHQWPVILTFLILGCLAGWVSSYLWPSYYRSTIQIFVGLNPYRTYSDANFLALARPKYSNIDDYKDWQMSQLEGVIFTPNFINPTLEELRAEDTYWQNISDLAFRQMLEADWRSAGIWSLVARHSEPLYATQAVEAWSKTISVGISDAVQASREAFMIDQELQAIADQKQAAIMRKEELNSNKTELLEWRETLENHPQDSALQPAERWRLLSIAVRPATFSPVWIAHLDNQPGPSAPPQDYVTWIDQIVTTIDAEVSNLKQQIDDLLLQRGALAQQFSSVSSSSFGLSPNLEIEEIGQSDLGVVRPTGFRTIMGGLIGLFTWVISRLIMITRRARQL